MKTIKTKMPFCESTSRWATVSLLGFGVFLGALPTGFGQAAQAIPLADAASDEMPAGLDYSFQPQIRGFWDGVSSLAVLADGKVLAAGTGRLVRLQANGSLDASFKAQIDVYDPVVAQADGKILISGPFGLARLNPDGSLDTAFNTEDTFIGAMALDATGRIIAGGIVNEKEGLIRLNSDGSIDTSFAVPPDVCCVTSIVVQPDGRIFITGRFGTVHGVERNGVARLNSDGTLDLTFDPGTALRMGMFFIVPHNTLTLQPDGRVLLAGTVQQIIDDEVIRNGFIRLNADGSVDPSFDAGKEFVNHLTSVLVQPDGKILVSGSFDTLAGQPRTGVARLNQDGSLDPDFKPRIGFEGGFEDGVLAVQIQTDGRILIGGRFDTVNGAHRDGIARLEPTTPPGIHLGLSELTQTVGENSGFASITVQRFGDTTPPVSVSYTTVTGSAVPGRDFAEQRGTIAFAPYERSKSLSVALIDNSLLDGNRTMGLVLSQPAGGAALMPQLDETRITIYDNEQPGSVDFTFNANFGGSSLTIQPDGKILVANVRLNADGTRDVTFKPNQGDQTITSMVTQSDGKVVVSSYVGDSPKWTNVIRRLNADGSFDPGFSPYVVPMVSGGVYAVQPDGKVLLVTTPVQILAPTPGNRPPPPPPPPPLSTLRRLNTDGSLDDGFKPFQFQGALTQVAVAKDGKILLAGYFDLAARLVRLNPNGSTDTTFKPQISSQFVSSFALRDDGKLIVISGVEGVARPFLRLNPDGSPDVGFKGESGIRLLGLQSRGRAIVDSGGTVRRLLADGSIDFGYIETLGRECVGCWRPGAMLFDDKILVFEMVLFGQDGGRLPAPFSSLLRLNADGGIDSTFTEARVPLRPNWEIFDFAGEVDGRAGRWKDSFGWRFHFDLHGFEW
ncbi:MAG: hypothetical protein L0Z50_41625 [Verrucomicrobiales bacterium]|nr:hypothetical protein [Verrucomicrobiales bacterium]